MTNEATPITPNSWKTSLDEFRNAYAIRGKNAGCSLQLRGKVVLVAFLVNDGESVWDEAAEKAFVSVLQSSADRLMAESGLSKEQLQVAYAWCRVDIPYAVNRKNTDNCVHDVLRQFGYTDAQSYQKHYEEKFFRDEAALSFVFNKTFRSHAQRISKQGTNIEAASPGGDEYSIVSFSAKDPSGSERTLLHELMHQFGAIDLYYPERLSFEANRLLPDSIMNSGNTIDPLTRYVIGWDTSLSEDAQAFLRAVSKISEADIEYARRKELQKQ